MLLPDTPGQPAAPRVLLVEPDAARRLALMTALEDAGVTVVGAAHIGDVERWPAGELVVTDVYRFTPWWKDVGATDVIVLADTPEQGTDACDRGAAAWLPRTCPPATLVALVLRSIRT